MLLALQLLMSESCQLPFTPLPLLFGLLLLLMLPSQCRLPLSLMLLCCLLLTLLLLLPLLCKCSLPVVFPLLLGSPGGQLSPGLQASLLLLALHLH